MKTALFVFVFSITSFTQITKQDSIWIPFEFFIGEWTGTGEGEPGKGKYERSYEFIFDKKFIEVKNKSTYPPTKEHPEGETHRDIGYLSYDKIRKIFILRQFHIEGFVNQYKLDSIYNKDNAQRMVFTSEWIENIRQGWRARESYEIIDEDEFIELFELAQPNGDFETYTKARLIRKK